MRKKFTALLFVFALCLGMAVPAFAADADDFADEYYRVIDMADILSDDEEAALNNRLDEISLRQNMDITLVTSADMNGYTSISDYAEELYEYCNYGYGDNKDGVLLFVCMSDHDWYIATHGRGIFVFTDAGIKYIGKKMKSDLSGGNYASAFDTYAGLCDDFITQANTGKPYDKNNLPRNPLSPVWIPVALAAGIIAAFIVVCIMKHKLKSVGIQKTANSYIKDGSLNITESRDLFLYRTVTKSEKAKSSTSSGSSTHESSSGSTYGGGGGKF